MTTANLVSLVYPQSWPIFMKNLDLLAMNGTQWVPGGRPSLHYGFMQRQYSLHQVTLTYHSFRFASPHCQMIGKSGWMLSWWGLMRQHQRSLSERFLLPTLKAFKKLCWNGGHSNDGNLVPFWKDGNCQSLTLSLLAINVFRCWTWLGQ